ncbi:MAG: hypothetical protein KDC54_20910, partial [Lewinella sp.]|nr:hypothetical protein [Lewinella sp.]
MKVTPLLSLLLIVAGGLTTMQAQPYYLQGSAAPCSWGNTSASCELTDPDNDGVFELTYDFGGAPIDVNEFKVYDSGNNNYIPGGANVWFNHQGGTVTFRYNSNNGDVDAIESAPFSICAPGEFSGWNNAEPMLDAGGNQWCYTIPTAGTYQW